jgi:hypothetical protein
MYIVDYTIARVLMEARLLEAEAGRRARRDHPAGRAYRSNPSWALTTVFRSAAHWPRGGH